jgi:hypothetical protein
MGETRGERDSGRRGGMVLMARKLADNPLREEQICKSAERTRAKAWIF